MSLILTLTSSSPSMSDLSSTTSSAIALGEIITGAAIVSCALVVLLVLNYLMSGRDSWNANTAAALRAISLPLIVTFCAFIVFQAAQSL
jgi:ABC-type nickel/cobalt efflux system permease component RcnA